MKTNSPPTSTPRLPSGPATTIKRIAWGSPTANQAQIFDGYDELMGTLRIHPPKAGMETGEIHLVDISGQVIVRCDHEKALQAELLKWDTRQKLVQAKRQRNKEAFFAIGKTKTKTSGLSR